ncbi:MAG TPA: N-acetylglucosamine-6-phosphate deacetylase [Candidatus Acidoferrales bacterium]|jgi:N-acetylglucosamine-6-phosphate deacetylase
MTPHAIFPERIFMPQREIRDGVVIVEGGRISAVGARNEVAVPANAKRIEARGFTLVPGFVDVHVHGAGGYDVMEATPEALNAVAVTLARGGTTSFLATTVTAAPDVLCGSAAGIAKFISAQTQSESSAAGNPRAEIVGIHFEGPFISPARRGVHPIEWIAAPSLALFARMVDAAAGTARVVTLAPEISGGIELVDAARKAGIVAALGHTDATYEQAMDAIAHGASHAAHVFNAMRPFSHRDTGVLGAVLTSPQVTAELIADGIHVDVAAMKILLNAKPEKVILVSDGTAATGMPDGKYRLGNFDVQVTGGVVRNSEGKLAGSALTLDRALRIIVALGIPFEEAVRMLTLYPARLLGVESRKGIIAAGADADLVFLDSNLEISKVVTRGVGLN